MLVVVAIARAVKLCKDASQRCLAKPSYCTRGESQSVVTSSQVALPLQLPFQITQRLEVAHPVLTEVLCQQVDVDIVQRRGLLALGQLVLKLFEISQISNGRDSCAVA